MTTGDPELGVEKFLQLVMGPSTASRAVLAPALEVEVRPDTLDFGQIDPGISPPMLLYISGNKGTSVRGTIQPVEPWIMVDTQSFDGMSTLVRVRVDSTDLQAVGGRFPNLSQPVSTHYQGSIVVRPAGEAGEYRIPVLLDVLGYKATGPSRGAQSAISRPSRTLEEEDDALVGSRGGRDASLPPPVMVTHRNTPADLSYQNAKYSGNPAWGAGNQAKYGTPDGGNGSASGNWNPARISAQQHMWLKRGLTFAAAFMAASLSYMFFAHFPSSAQVPPLPPSQGFIAVLLSMIPLATLGALVADRDVSRGGRDVSLPPSVPPPWLNRFYTGLVITLSTLGLGELVWHKLLGVNAPVLH